MISSYQIRTEGHTLELALFNTGLFLMALAVSGHPDADEFRKWLIAQSIFDVRFGLN